MACWEEMELGRQHFSIVSAKRFPVTVRLRYMTERMKQFDFSQIGFTYAHPILPEFLTGYEFLKFYIDINKDKIKDKKSIPEYFDMIKIKEEDW